MSTSFEFTRENQDTFNEILKRYPAKRAAMLPALHLAQQQQGFISAEVEEYVAGLLEVPVVDVHEVLTFYSLFNRSRPGKHTVRLCMNISCWLRGADRIKDHLEGRFGVRSGQQTGDGKFSWEAYHECMGACEMAPMMQVDKDYFGNLTVQKADEILDKVKD